MYSENNANRNNTEESNMKKFTVYEIDYHDRCWVVGDADTIQEARKLARKALKRTKGEFPTFITHEGKMVC